MLFIVISQCPVLCFAPEPLLGTCGLLLGLGWQTLHAGVSSTKAFFHYKITYGLRGRNVEVSFFESENCHRFHEVSQALLKHTQQQCKQETQPVQGERPGPAPKMSPLTSIQRPESCSLTSTHRHTPPNRCTAEGKEGERQYRAGSPGSSSPLTLLPARW